jgi:L-Ala-D/L-Glu epimerase
MTPAKIIKVEIQPLNIALDAPFTIATGAKHNIENVLITIELQNGIVGYGEAAPLEPVNGENQATALATLQSVKDFLIGKDVFEFRQIARNFKGLFRVQATARCAVEMALLDAYTKCLGISFHHFAGGTEPKLETDYTIDIVDAETAKSNARKLWQQGYRTLKTKVGKNMADDIDRLVAIREGAPESRLMLDANQGYSPYEAVRFIRELEKRDILPDLFEQPVSMHNLEGMKFVKDHISVPVAADESVFTPVDALAVVKHRCADLINIKIMKSGLLEAFEIAAIARNAGLDLMIGCMLESKLGLSASVALAAGIGGFKFVDLDPHIDPDKEPFLGGPAFSAPFYTLSDKTGIGVDLK